MQGNHNTCACMTNEMKDIKKYIDVQTGHAIFNVSTAMIGNIYQF